jgi:5'-deoxynucleotidase
MGKNDFFAFTSRTKYINRWALMRNTRYETLSEHSAEVAQLCYALATIGNQRLGKDYNCERAALLGLYHDTPEIITGDLPTPVKYYSKETKEAYKAVEKNASKQLLSMLPEDLLPSYEPLFKKKNEDKELWKLVKAADKISGYLKCVEETRAGNAEFKKAQKSIGDELKKCGSKEVQYYLKEFAPAFELTLDELD